MLYIKTLTIAGSDCSGGAGVQADIKTMSALGCYAASVITAITAQNTQGVYAVSAVSPCVITAQIDAVMQDLAPQHIKIGMMNNAETINAIADSISHYSYHSLIIDPVMVSTSGCQLMLPHAITLLRDRIIPLATLLTPNIPEAEQLTGITIDSDEQAHKAASLIRQMGARAVLIKGGHRQGTTKTDWLYTDDGQRYAYTSPTVNTHNTHGTGCTLSSAITAFIAKGDALPQAVQHAKEYVSKAIAAGNNITTGKGCGPVNHFFNPLPLITQ